MGWDVDIAHRTNDYLVDADYWSRLKLTFAMTHRSANTCTLSPTFVAPTHRLADFQ
jgi:hypothetical protein